jgi:hypothetical protein
MKTSSDPGASWVEALLSLRPSPAVVELYAAPLRDVSLRGRVALCLVCAERTLAQLESVPAEIASALESMWGFVEAQNIVTWDNDPEAQRGFNAVYRFMSLAQYHEAPPRSAIAAVERLREFDREVIWMLWVAYDIPAGYLYTKMDEGYGKESVDGVLQTLEIARRRGVPLPSLEPFLAARFSEDAGWGNPISRSSFRDAR